VTSDELIISATGGPPEKPVVVNDAQASVLKIGLGELWSYRELLFFLTWRDIKVRYKQTAVGAAWAIIQPLFLMLTFAIFFGLFIGIPTDGMPHMVFFYCGLMPWTFFSGAVSTASMSLVSSSNLITKVYFPRLIVPAASVGSGLVDLAITSAILIILAVFYRMPFSAAFLFFPVFVVQTVILSLSLGLWLSGLTVKYRDVRHALPFVLQMWMFLTPIMYPLSVVPKRWRWVMYLNPLTGISEGIRASISDHAFNWPAIMVSWIVTLLTLAAAITAFRRLETSFADLI
jgi:lipopolysaccharide transport system permease protein